MGKLNAESFGELFQDGMEPQHPASKEMFEIWHADAMLRMKNFVRVEMGEEIPGDLLGMIHDVQWLSWNASPLFARVEEKDKLLVEELKNLYEENNQLKATNQQLRYTIDNVLSEGINGN
jgi:hypothetical protein